jgi:hypothetical protein
MRAALKYAVIGGVLVAVALYLFPLYVGQEMFVNYLTDQAGGNYETGVIWAAILAGALLIVGFYLLRPKMFGNPIYMVGGIAVLVVAGLLLMQLFGGA